MENYHYPDKLESARLITRHLTMDDIDTWQEFFASPEAITYFPKPPVETNHDWSKLWIERQLVRYAEKRFGMQVLIEKATGEFIGQCGLLKQEVEGKQELEVGYHIFRKNWGKGYAPEAAKMFMDFAFEHKLSESIISIIHKDNHRSQRVAEKNGLERDFMTRWTTGFDAWIYRIFPETN